LAEERKNEKTKNKANKYLQSYGEHKERKLPTRSPGNGANYFLQYRAQSKLHIRTLSLDGELSMIGLE